MKTTSGNEKNDQITLISLSADLSYAALIDAEEGEVEITDEMIREACDCMEDLQVYPFTGIASRLEAR